MFKAGEMITIKVIDELHQYAAPSKFPIRSTTARIRESINELLSSIGRN
jgi:hypothetical protein